MINLLKISIVILGLSTALASAQTADLTGVWLRASGSNNYPMSQWNPAELPFTAAGRAVFDANNPGKGPRQAMPAFGNDPLGQANPPGLYRTLVYGRPMELVQMDGKVIQLFEWGTPYTDFTEIEERWHRADAQTLELTITVTDPELYSQAWTSDVKTFALQATDSLNGELMEQIFAPIDEIEFNESIRDRAASGPKAIP